MASAISFCVFYFTFFFNARVAAVGDLKTWAYDGNSARRFFFTTAHAVRIFTVALLVTRKGENARVRAAEHAAARCCAMAV